MGEQEIVEIYKLLKKGYEKSDWDLIQESIDFISEFIDLEEENNEE